MTQQLNPHLIFPGTCAEAMEFYASVLGGVPQVSTFSEYGMEVAAVMHAALATPAGFHILGSDALDEAESRLHVGTNVQISLSGDPSDAHALRSYWDALAEGGEVLETLQAQMWGDECGLLVDKFGIHWHVSIAASAL